MCFDCWSKKLDWNWEVDCIWVSTVSTRSTRVRRSQELNWWPAAKIKVCCLEQNYNCRMKTGGWEIGRRSNFGYLNPPKYFKYFITPQKCWFGWDHDDRFVGKTRCLLFFIPKSAVLAKPAERKAPKSQPRLRFVFDECKNMGSLLLWTFQS